MQPAATDYDNFYGLDFDWFALDNAGIIAVFSTAGYGEIPHAVRQQAPAHSIVFEQLTLPNWGSNEIWEDYGRLGLFTFDWQHWGGPYVKMAAPSRVMPVALRSQILSIPDLPQLDLRFGAAGNVTIPPDIL
jgi:hypothetical protein